MLMWCTNSHTTLKAVVHCSSRQFLVGNLYDKTSDRSNLKGGGCSLAQRFRGASIVGQGRHGDGSVNVSSYDMGQEGEISGLTQK